MSYNFYSFLHLGSLFALCLILGALWGLYASPSPDKKLRKLLLALHGLIMFFIFLAGFALIAKVKIPFPWPFWIYGKLAAWVLLGASPFVIKKISRSSKGLKFYPLVLLVLFILLFSTLLIVKLKWP